MHGGDPLDSRRLFRARSGALALALAFGVAAAASRAGAEPAGERVDLWFDDASWSGVVYVVSKVLDGALVVGEVPECRVTIKLWDLTQEQVLERLWRFYGIAFVEAGGSHTIFLPRSTQGLCGKDLVTEAPDRRVHDPPAGQGP